MATTTGVVTAFFGVMSSVFQWALERLKLQNTAEMRKNAASRIETAIKDRAGRMVAGRDIDSVRKVVAE